MNSLIALITLGTTQSRQVQIPEICYLSGYQECIVGLKPHASLVLGQFRYVTTLPISNLQGFSELNPKDLMARQPIRIGHASAKVSNSVFEGKSCLLFEADGRRTHAKQFRNSNEIDVLSSTPTERYRKVWLTPEGVPIHETSGFRNYQGTWQLDAKFKGDEIEITTSGPRGKKTATIFPAGGIELFANEFKPMVSGEKILLSEKTFSQLDPLTGGVIQITAKLGVKFEGTMFLKKFSGHRVDFSTGQTREVAFVTKEMDLLQVNLPRGESLMTDIDPTETKSDVKRVGGR